MTPRLRPIAATFLLVLAPGARAASFDCAKARQPAEKLICSDPALSRLDEELSAAYREARKQVSAPAAESLKASQRSWNGFWPRACSADPKAVKLGKDAVGCATREFEDRVRVLRSVARIDGRFTVVPVSRFAVLETAPEENGSRMATHAWSYPQVDRVGLAGPDAELARKLNDWLTPSRAAIEETMADRTSTTATVTQLWKVTRNLFGAFTSAEFYAFGAAHPLDGTSAAYFDALRGRPLRAEDLFTGTGWVDVLAKTAFAQLQAALEDGLQVEKAADLRELVVRPGSWRFTREALGLDFGVYEVAPYAAGPQEAAVPWSALEAHLTAFGKGEVASLR